MAEDKMRDRDYCLSILKEYTKSENLLKHAYAVEACVRAYAEKFGEDVEYWGNVGLLHDFDYEKYPTAEEHPYKGYEILKEKGFDEEFREAILSHAEYTGVPRDTLLKKTLFACDELSGFITAVTLVRPNKDLNEVKVKSVKKKMKDKAFARAVSREDIIKGAEELGIPLEEHIEFCIEAMKKVKEVLGL
jgi:putative nucleotidyltransferase with HDIG domain